MRGTFYQRVREHVLAQITDGTLRPGDKLPSERALCETFTLNRNTVRHALLTLQREGKIFRLERKGWYVSTVRLVYNPANHINFAKLAASQHMQARWTTSNNGKIVVTDQIDAGGSDGFPAGTHVYEMENTYFLDEQKVAHTISYLHVDMLEGIIPKTTDKALTQVVEEEYGIQLMQRNLIIRPMLLPKDITDHLGISHGSPGMYVRRIKTDGADTVVTVEHEYWRFDAIELRVDTLHDHATAPPCHEV
ncbi:MAG: GntR family transcriptional regulator [Desulfovibrionales bacterium]|nr:GntR family transcriptional regulator [Desulfovibrionales bacterium]